MIPSRFNQPIMDQLQAAKEAMDLLDQFCRTYPHTKPFCLFPGVPSVSFNSGDTETVRDTFGPEGWTVQGTVVKKEVDGVLVELHLPRPQQQPFTL